MGDPLKDLAVVQEGEVGAVVFVASDARVSIWSFPVLPCPGS